MHLWVTYCSFRGLLIILQSPKRIGNVQVDGGPAATMFRKDKSTILWEIGLILIRIALCEVRSD